MSCPHFVNGVCKVACLLARTENVPTFESSCKACEKEGKSQTVNKITIGLAILHLNQKKLFNRVDHAYLITAVREAVRGVGTILQRKLSWFVKPTQSCDCESKAAVMDTWGPDRCESERETILGWLKESADEQKILFVKPVVSCILSSAIKEARKDV